MTREEAIRRIKAWNLDSDDMGVLAAVIPELRESEDERIRARLIEYFKGFLEGYEDCYKDGGCVKWEGLDVKSILAWLEKQKEQKPAEWKPQPESLEALMYAIEGKWDAIRPTSYLSRRLEDLYEGLVNTFNVDESLLAELPKVASRANTAEGIEELRELKHKIEASMEQKPNIEICPHSIKSKSYKEKPAECEDCAMYLSGNCIHPNGKCENVKSKQEWSEEDEEISKRIIADLRWGRRNTVSDKDIRQYGEEINWMENRLKSLRPVSKEFLQPHWKPSEEHFQGLRRAILKADTGSDAERTLKDIYEQLKKL